MENSSTFVGSLLKKIIEDTEMKISNANSTAPKKMFIYAGHDVTIFSILHMLDITVTTEVVYGSYVLLEVHNINGTYGFKVSTVAKMRIIFILYTVRS